MAIASRLGNGRGKIAACKGAGVKRPRDLLLVRLRSFKCSEMGSQMNRETGAAVRDCIAWASQYYGSLTFASCLVSCTSFILHTSVAIRRQNLSPNFVPVPVKALPARLTRLAE